MLSKEKKLALAKAKKADQQQSIQKLEQLHVDLNKLLETFNERLTIEVTKGDPELANQLTELNNIVVTFMQSFEMGLMVKNMPVFDEVTVKNLSDIVIPDIIKLANPIEMPDDLATNEEIGEFVDQLNSTLLLIRDDLNIVLRQILENNNKKPSQDIKDFIPTRRVISHGGQLVFDDFTYEQVRFPVPLPTFQNSSGQPQRLTLVTSTTNGIPAIPVVNPNGTNISGGGGGGGGGTEYTQDTAVSQPVTAGTLLFDKASNWTHVTDTDGLPVTLVGTPSVAIASGSVNTNVADGADLAQGATTDAPYTSGNGSVVSILKGIYAAVAGTITTARSWVLDSTTDSVTTVPSGTQAVSGTFWQTTQPISVSALPLPTGAATSANQTTELTQLGIVTETAPASDTASSGLNGRLQRIAQRLTSIIALLPTSLGAGGGLKVDGSGTALPVSGTVTANTGLTQPLTDTQLRASAVPVSLSTNTPTLAAGTNLAGKISVADDTSTVYNGTTALTPKFAKIVASSSGATTIVAAVTSKKIRVLALKVTASGAVNFKWQSHVTPTDLTGLSYDAANGGEVLPYSPVGWFETVAGEALDINLSGAIAVGGHLTYVEV